MKIKVSNGQSINDYHIYTITRAFGKIRITGYTNCSGYDPTPFFGSIEDAVKYGDDHGFDLLSEMEKEGWKVT